MYAPSTTGSVARAPRGFGVAAARREEATSRPTKHNDTDSNCSCSKIGCSLGDLLCDKLGHRCTKQSKGGCSSAGGQQQHLKNHAPAASSDKKRGLASNDGTNGATSSCRKRPATGKTNRADTSTSSTDAANNKNASPPPSPSPSPSRTPPPTSSSFLLALASEQEEMDMRAAAQPSTQGRNGAHPQ
jgi:hypothetical protein